MPLRSASNKPTIPPLIAPADWRWMAGVTALYLLYLPFSGYTQQHYDAQSYWELPSRFITAQRQFSLLHYSAMSRGYAWPLVLAPWRAAWKLLGGDPMWYVRVLGSVVAGVCYGWLGPRLWQALRGQVPPPGPLARLAFVLTGFVLWRDYFNFALTDFPALLALGAALVLAARGLVPQTPALSGRALGCWLLVGGLLGLACNFRGIYSLSLYPVLVAVAWPTAPGGAGVRGSAGRVVALALGLALVLAPQYLMVQRHTPPGTEWRLSGVLNQDQLVQRHLGLGIRNFRYETNIGADYSEVRVWLQDPIGQALAQRHHIPFAGIGQGAYLQLAARYPLEFSCMLAMRLFNGLDLQQPTPYLPQLYSPTWLLAANNYTVLGLGLLVLGKLLWSARRLPWRRVLLAVALLLPALGALPMAVENRFLLPLHFGLCIAATLGWPAAWHPARLRRTLRPAQGVVLLGLYVGWLVLAFTLSSYAYIQLEQGGRLPGGSGPAPLSLPGR